MVLLATGALFSAMAAPVDGQKARLVATNFLKTQGIKGIDLVDVTAATPFTEFYVFAGADGKGFVLVSGDDCVVPILGYSADNAFVSENMPSNIRGWLDDCEDQIRFYAGTAKSLRTAPQQADTPQRQWDNLLNGRDATPNSITTAVAPLLSTTWNQSPYYNSLCPYDNTYSERTVTGCVATAMAQVMKFWNHPATGYGSHSYTSDYGTLSANFGTTSYAWSSMPNSLSSSSTTAQINAVATLMYHVGVALEMEYGPATTGGSSAYTECFQSSSLPCAENALRYYFKYKSSLRSIHLADYSSAQWNALLTNDLTNGRPILYSGRDSLSGHCFVCDGCNNSGQYHFNWGWGGYCDGYYTIGSLNPTAGGTGGSSSGTYNLKNTVILGIVPNTDFGSGTTVTALPNNSSYGSVSGGGSYSGTNSSLVTLTATANSGCRFTGWTDGYRDNPRQFYANGGTYNFTANFVPLTGDTLFYCASYNVGSYGSTSGATTWGIKLPASTLTAGHDLTKIHLYLLHAGSYTLNIYTGTTSPTTTAYTTTFTAPSTLEDHWASLTLGTPVPIDGTQSVWVVLQSSVSYPAATSYNAGNNDSRLWGTSLSPTTIGSFMIRAVFAAGSTPPATGDTASYCDTASYATSIGTNGGAFDWGIKLPASMYSHRNYVTDVMLYVPDAGAYTLNIYQGASTSSSTLVATQSTTFGSSAVNQWQTIHLTNPIATSSTQPLWVTFHTNGISYPAAACAYTGDTNSCLVSLDGSTWQSIMTASGGSLSYSWLIKAILSNSAAPSIHISGPSTVGTGIASIFTVSGPVTAYSWTLTGATPSSATGDTVSATWSAPGTYNVIVNATYGGYNLSDTLSVTVQNCAITTFPYTMGFESSESMMGWSNVDADGDGYSWEYLTTRLSSSATHSGSDAFASASYINNIGALTPDNWLVTPQIQLASGHTYTLTWWDGAVDANYYNEHYSVYLSTTGNQPTNFTGTPLLSTTLTTNNYTKRTIDLTPYAGQTVFLAFRHHNVSDIYWLLIDDIRITQDSGSTPATYTITAIANDSTMGTVTGGGSYASGATATLTATPYSGYHFVQWNDGHPNATRTITVTSNATYTAYFAADAPAWGDTISYCDTAALINSIGTGGGAFDWGIKLPASAYSHRSYVSGAMLYVPSAGTYTLNIYQGATTSSATLAATANATFSSADEFEWHTISLPSPIASSSTQPLWVTFHNSSLSYPASACTYTGDTNSCLISFDATNWMSIMTASEGSLTYSWMIKAILTDNAAPNISISGPSMVGSGIPATFTANGPAGATYSWTLNGATPSSTTGASATATWAAAGTYNVILTAIVSGSTLRDTLAVTVQNCAINTFPYEMGFEASDDMTCWGIYDQDGDSYSWSSTNNYFNSEPDLAHSGNAAFGSASFINDIGALTPDNWLVSPQVQLASGHTYTLTWWDGAVDADYYDEHYSVYVSTTGNQPSSFTATPVFSTTLTTANYTQRTVDLSSYAGQNIYIAFRHHNSEDVYWLLIDDLVISQGDAPDPDIYTITVLSSNPAMGSVSGGGNFPAGTSTTISATANNGYHFTQWNDGNTSAVRTIVVSGDATYTAYFAQNEVESYTITVLSANESMGTVSGGGTYPAGTSVTIAATANSGFHFSMWNDGNTNAVRTITVTADATYIASFVPDATGINGIDGTVAIAALPGKIIRIVGAEHCPITIYDIMGRRIANQNSADAVCDIQISETGVYMVVVGQNPAHRVVIVR